MQLKIPFFDTISRMDTALDSSLKNNKESPDLEFESEFARLRNLIESHERKHIADFVSDIDAFVPAVLAVLENSADHRSVEATMLQAIEDHQIKEFRDELLNFALSSNTHPDNRAHVLYRLSVHDLVPSETMEQILKGEHFPIAMRMEALDMIEARGSGRSKVK